MKKVIDAVLGGTTALLAVPVTYLGGLTLVALASERSRSRSEAGTDAATNRFVILVPAHDESASIGLTLASLTAQRYPTDRYAVHVVADNCTDDTAAVAASFEGVHVHERHDTVNRGKGPALNWLLQRVLDADPAVDVAVFVDADTTVEPGFLAEVDRAFVAGAAVVQGHYGVRQAFDSVPATLRYCALATRHHLRPLGRCAIGGSCGLFGNGMAFRRDVIARRRWQDHLVEDMQLQLDLMMEGTLVQYVPGARVEAEMPNTFEASVTQHQRWEGGRVQILRAYWPKLVRALIRGGRTPRVAAADSLLDMSTPPMSLLGAAIGASALVGAAWSVVAPSPASRRNAGAGAALVVVFAGHVIAGLRAVEAPPAAYRSLVRAPQLAVWKLRTMLGIGASNPDNEWVRTSRNENTG